MTLHNSQDCVTFDDFEQLMLGKPYVDRCCHVDAVDCWGLVVLFYRLCLGVNVHHNDDYDKGSQFSTCFNGEVVFWRDTNKPVKGDIVVAFHGNAPVHIALVWGRDKILHAREKTAVRFDRLRTLERLSTQIRFYKYASDSCSETTWSAEGNG